MASEEELALLRERFRTPPAPPPPQELGKTREDLIRRVEKPLREVWPAESAPLISYEVGFTPEEILVRVRYQSKTSLDATAEAMLTKVLQTRLNEPELKLILERETPPRTASRKSR